MSRSVGPDGMLPPVFSHGQQKRSVASVFLHVYRPKATQVCLSQDTSVGRRSVGTLSS